MILCQLTFSISLSFDSFSHPAARRTIIAWCKGYLAPRASFDTVQLLSEKIAGEQYEDPWVVGIKSCGVKQVERAGQWHQGQPAHSIILRCKGSLSHYAASYFNKQVGLNC